MENPTLNALEWVGVKLGIYSEQQCLLTSLGQRQCRVQAVPRWVYIWGGLRDSISMLFSFNLSIKFSQRKRAIKTDCSVVAWKSQIWAIVATAGRLVTWSNTRTSMIAKRVLNNCIVFVSINSDVIMIKKINIRRSGEWAIAIAWKGGTWIQINLGETIALEASRTSCSVCTHIIRILKGLSPLQYSRYSRCTLAQAPAQSLVARQVPQ